MKTDWIPASNLPPLDNEYSALQGYDRSAPVLVWDRHLEEYGKMNGHPDKEPIQKGFFLFGILNEWRLVNQNGKADVACWMPLPDVPTIEREPTKTSKRK